LNLTTMNNIDHQLVQQATCKLKMVKCSWNVVKLGNNQNVLGWKRTRFLLVNLTSFSSLHNNMVGFEGEKRFGICRQKLGILSRSIGDSHNSSRIFFLVPHCHKSKPFDSSQHVVPPSSFQFKSTTNMASTDEGIPSIS
jgi:hypothetical protein